MAVEWKYQTFGPRFAAGFLDGGGMAPLFWIDQLVWSNTTQPSALISWMVLYGCLSFTYTIYLLARFGGTPGKRASGVIVKTVDEKPITLKHAILRNIVGIIMYPFFLYPVVNNVLAGHLEHRGTGGDFTESIKWFLAVTWGWMVLEFITMFSNSRRRAIHDFIAGTVVVREETRSKKMLMLQKVLLGLFVLNIFMPVLFGDKNMKHPHDEHPSALSEVSN